MPYKKKDNLNMEYILAIDDTDDLQSPGTGEHLEEISKLLEANKLCRCSRITRHQLFFSPLVKYTSHNSSMSITLSNVTEPEQIFELACSYLKTNSAPGSDPGVCLLQVEGMPQNHIEALLAFGRKAKTEYVEKHEALDLAKTAGVMLREIGGEGIGVIGALAGAALRLNGNDGRYKGKLKLAVNQDNMRCADILTHPYIDIVATEDGEELSGDTEVYVTDEVKTVNLNNKAVLLVKKCQTEHGEAYVNLTKKELKKY